MPAKEEGHIDMSRLQVQVLRSTFLLLILAVTILVIFSSLAVLRNPEITPMLNVIVDMNAKKEPHDQGARSRRGAVANSNHDAHASVHREILFEGRKPIKDGRKDHRGHKGSDVLRVNKSVQFLKGKNESRFLNEIDTKVAAGNGNTDHLKTRKSPKNSTELHSTTKYSKLENLHEKRTNRSDSDNRDSRSYKQHSLNRKHQRRKS